MVTRVGGGLGGPPEEVAFELSPPPHHGKVWRKKVPGGGTEAQVESELGLREASVCFVH
jgi:hypothetical protein